MRVSLTVQPPGEEPFVFELDDKADGYCGKKLPWMPTSSIPQRDALRFPPVPGLGPALRRRHVAAFAFSYGIEDSPRKVVVEEVVGATTWRFELLGFDNPLTGTVTPFLSAPEGAETRPGCWACSPARAPSRPRPARR